MSKLRAFFQTVSWKVWAVLAAIVAVGAWVAHRLFLSPPERVEPPSTGVLPAVQERVVRAEERALVAKAQAAATAQEHHDAIQEIAKVEDGKERRRRLAELLSTLK